jgi:hypothetical protein
MSAVPVGGRASVSGRRRMGHKLAWGNTSVLVRIRALERNRPTWGHDNSDPPFRSSRAAKRDCAWWSPQK